MGDSLLSCGISNAIWSSPQWGMSPFDAYRHDYVVVVRNIQSEAAGVPKQGTSSPASPFITQVYLDTLIRPL